MKPGQPTVSAQKTAAAATRVAAMTIVALATALAPLPPDAGATAAESDFPHANTEVAEIARPHTEDKTPGNLGFADRVQDWLARANREYQTTVIPRLSIPPAGGAVAGDDAIAKKLEKVKEQDAEAAEAAARATEALKAAEAKQAEEARQRAAEAKRAETARKVAEDAKRAQEARKAAEAEEAKRAEDARKAVQEAKAQEPPAPPPPQPQQAASPKPDDGAALAEAKRKERERIEAEATRIEADREAAEAQRRADEAKHLEDERVKAAAKLAEAKLTEARLTEERQRVAAVEAEKNTTRQIEITPEPISPAGDAASQKFPSGNDTPETDEDLKDSVPAPPRRSGNIRATPHTLARGPAVERWVRRVRHGHCRFAGRRITPPGHYTVRRGDSLWLISRRHYRTGRLYRKLYRANRSTIRNPNLIHPCQRIYIPRRHP